MANFNDLPKAVRERIYAIHLERDEPIKIDKHYEMIQHKWAKNMPPLLRISKKVEKEAMSFYYANNHFIFDNLMDLTSMNYSTWPRHLRLVRKVTFTWRVHESCATSIHFEHLAHFKGLQELYIRVDEKGMVRKMLLRDSAHQRARIDDPTPQQQLTILRFPGIVGLLRVQGVPHVEFIKLVNKKGEEWGGPIPGGVLQTQVAMKMQARAMVRSPPKSESDSFEFLALPPELRNTVYHMLLCVEGQLSPSPNPSTSALRKRHTNAAVPDSALSLLAVNRQIHDEAVGIFYHSNALLFHYSLHLHAFLQSLGSQRLGAIRDITVHYADVKSGGMSMVDLTFALLKNLSGLRRLEVVMHGDLARKFNSNHIANANPGMLPGMKALFELRGVDDIQVRDLSLEERLEDLKEDKSYPNFGHSTSAKHTVKISRALEHLNAALVEAQSGRVNGELLADNGWQQWNVFPTMQNMIERCRSPEL